MIKDSGERTAYDTGAVRDLKEGKGRFDLVPLADLARIGRDEILKCIADFEEDGNIYHLDEAYRKFAVKAFGKLSAANIELSIHFEEGAKKYEENNWKKGIPESSYIDSAVRHYCKWQRGDDDERHDRAFLWNVICLIWTHEKAEEEPRRVEASGIDPAWNFDRRP